MPDPRLPSFAGNIGFNAQHSPMGAFLSFTCGHPNTRGGFGLQIGKPGNQDLYIGVKDGARLEPGPLKCLPFFRSGNAGAVGAADFLVEQAGPAEQNMVANVVGYPKEKIRRRFGWASDVWETDDFSFTIYTPFGPIPDPETSAPDDVRRAIRPAIVAELTIDNSMGTAPKTGFLAMNFNEPGWLPLKGAPGQAGFSFKQQAGVLGEVVSGDAPEAPDLFCRWTADGGLAERVPHLLGSCPGLAFEVAPGETKTLRVALGCFLDHAVTTGIEATYFYTRYFASLPDVVTSALDDADLAIAEAEALDARLLASGLSSEQQFLIAHATRSYYGSTQLLAVGGQPFWVVNEGEYCMMNTLDLSVDHMFWELSLNPWVVRNLLDEFVARYGYIDQIKIPKPDHPAFATAKKDFGGNDLDVFGGKQRVLGETIPMDAFELHTGGIAFCHDMGAHNNFSPAGHSSYELPDLTGCFSYMTSEQLCNWSLMAATYVAHTGDTNWAMQNAHVLSACVHSLVNRGGEDGFVQYDSSRCATGSEITTYDSLDHSLAQTRNNVYIAVKCWASYAGLSLLLDVIGDSAPADLARERLEKVAGVVARNAGADGVIPAIFETGNPGHASRILPAIEGLTYVLDWQSTDFAGRAAQSIIVMPNTAKLIAALGRHTRALVLDAEKRNLFPDGGIKLSSTSNNSWMSKIALFMHVARELFDGDGKLAPIFARADAAHVKWQTDGSAYWACCDQIVSGEAKGSRYYPRIITSAMWMKGK